MRKLVQQYIEYIKSREDALCAHDAIAPNTDYKDDIRCKSYNKLISDYRDLIHSRSIWEVTSTEKDKEKKSAANMLIERRRIFITSGEIFYYVKPFGQWIAPYFALNKDEEIQLYLYPDFVVGKHKDGSFDILSYDEFDIEFSRSKFLEQSPSDAPDDAKFVRYTYKYVNKNGERDARYSNNPQYGVYEYGYLTFQPFGITLQISNADAAENFYKQYKAFTKGQYEYTDDYFGASEDYFNESWSVATALNDFYGYLLKDRKIKRYAAQLESGLITDTESKIRALYLADIAKCYESLGHDCTNLECPEGLPMALVEGLTVNSRTMTYDAIQTKPYKDVVASLISMNEELKEAIIKNYSEDYFSIQNILHICKEDDLVIKYFALLYRFFSVVAKADGTISERESAWLEKLMSYSQSTNMAQDDAVENDASQSQQAEETPQEAVDTNPLSELKSLIGLDAVKKEVEALANFVKIQKEREKKGLKSVGLSYHCVFTGNPGTGKTTVARIVASIYKDLGLLKKGQLIETDRAGLVAEYVGQTAVKTNKIIDSALDGILFIDEAYSLVQGGASDYGMEAISTLLKRMEDDRDRLIVILAGYSDEMKLFIDSNPGLQSRFNRYIHFEDYTADELKEIFLKQAKDNDYQLDDDATNVLCDALGYAVEHKDKNFGNGRFVRNLFEKSLQKQAARLARQANTTTKDLCLLKGEDITNV